uniref:KxDL domain-containing protein n=1 Tax=Ascaris lumbricoides TaxID=6252 RepID=A0A0M3IEP3_ASCLU
MGNYVRIHVGFCVAFIFLFIYFDAPVLLCSLHRLFKLLNSLNFIPSRLMVSVPDENFGSSSSTDEGTGEEHLVESLVSQIDSDNIATIIRLQKKSLIRFEKTNEMLSNCCLLSAKRLERAKKELTENKELILQMKSDLESVFRRIRIFKQDLVALYPDICKQFGKLYSNIETDERGGTKKVQIFFMFDF